MRPGERITFRPLEEYPQLVFPPKWRISGGFLQVPPKETLGVRLPKSDRAMTLEAKMRFPFETRGTLIVRGDSVATREFRIDGQDAPSLRFAVAPGPERTIGLRFEFTPRLRRREALPVQLRDLRIRSLRLD